MSHEVFSEIEQYLSLITPYRPPPGSDLRHDGAVTGPHTLHLTTGLPGTGKTTLARRIALAENAIRLTPDEWMQPLFGASDRDGARDILEGRLLWVAFGIARAGANVVVDFGCWSPQERYAVRALAECAGARFRLHHRHLPEAERRRRATLRWEQTPHETFPMSEADHDRFAAAYQAPDAGELAGGPYPPPPEGLGSWTAYGAQRWPTLPDVALAPPR